MDAETRKKRTDGSFASAQWHRIPKEGFSRTGEDKISVLSSGAGSVDNRGCSLVVQKFWGSLLKFESIGRDSERLLLLPCPLLRLNAI